MSYRNKKVRRVTASMPSLIDDTSPLSMRRLRFPTQNQRVTPLLSSVEQQPCPLACRHRQRVVAVVTSHQGIDPEEWQAVQCHKTLPASIKLKVDFDLAIQTMKPRRSPRLASTKAVETSRCLSSCGTSQNPYC